MSLSAEDIEEIEARADDDDAYEDDDPDDIDERFVEACLDRRALLAHVRRLRLEVDRLVERSK